MAHNWPQKPRAGLRCHYLAGRKPLSTFSLNAFYLFGRQRALFSLWRRYLLLELHNPRIFPNLILE
jgi:hypothetical protein